MQDTKIIRFKDLNKKIGISKSTIDRWEKKGHFPKRIKLGINSIGWKLKEIEDWLFKISLIDRK